MKSFYAGWWQLLGDLRPFVRFLAERFPRLAPSAVRIRSILHWLAGNPFQSLVILLTVCVCKRTGLPLPWLLLVPTVAAVSFEFWMRLVAEPGVFLDGWRKAWRVRRRWPADWAMVAAKTARVQAEVGTSKEPIASAVLRPIADHPKMSWLPRIDWPVVSWRVGPPPGRSLAVLDELAVVLAANISQVSDVAVEYERENDSFGRLVVSFEDVLAKPTIPKWATKQSTSLADTEPDDFDSEIDAFRQELATAAQLRLIDGEAS